MTVRYHQEPPHKTPTSCWLCSSGWPRWVGSDGHVTHELPEPGGMHPCQHVEPMRSKPGGEADCDYTSSPPAGKIRTCWPYPAHVIEGVNPGEMTTHFERWKDSAPVVAYIDRPELVHAYNGRAVRRPKVVMLPPSPMRTCAWATLATWAAIFFIVVLMCGPWKTAW